MISPTADFAPAPASSYEPQAAVLRQLHYYFSEANLSHDEFMREKLAEGGGWVSLELILSFNRMRRTGLSRAEVARMVREGSEELEVDAAEERVRRVP